MLDVVQGCHAAYRSDKRGAKKEMRRDEKAWRALIGIWKGKKLIDPIKWQRRIRSETSR